MILFWIFAPMAALLGVVAWLALLVELFDRVSGKNPPPPSNNDDLYF